MRFVNQGLSLWYATPDAPAPEDAVPAGAEELVTVGLSPPDGSNWVDVHYRINGKPVNTVSASWFRNDHARGAQYFTARLPPFEAGDEVEFWATAACAGRYVPAPDAARTAVMRLRVEESAIDVVAAASMRPTSPQSEMARSCADVAQGGRVAGESFFVPSTAWLVKKVTVLEPSFLPGEVGPTWIGPLGVKDLVISAEPVLIMLYLAGYEVPEIAIGNSTTEWVSFHPTDLRIRLGSGSWFDHVGSAHPGAGTQLLAVHAMPMAHQQRPVDPTQPVWGTPIPITMMVGGFTIGTEPATISARDAGWIVLGTSPASVLGVRGQIFPYVIGALTTFQSAQSVTEPPGLVGMYDPVNWRAIASTSTADPAVDRVETLCRVTLRLTGIRPQFGGGSEFGGWLSNDNDPDTHPTLTAERASAFLDLEIPPAPRLLINNAGESKFWPLHARVDALRLPVDEQNAAIGELKDLERYGAYPDLQSLTLTILDLHDRGLVDVLGGFAGIAAGDDPCSKAKAIPDAKKLTAEDVVTMCDCLDRGITPDSHVVAKRLVDGYASLYADAESRATIRSTLIGACEAAESHNRALNASSVGAAADTESAEYFAGLLAATLTSEPDPDADGFDLEQYVNPLLEVADAWKRWILMLTGRPTSAKLISITCDVFVDCGHPEVSRLAAERVIDHYQQGLTNLEQESGHHWTDPVYGDEFQDWGSERPAVADWPVAGWREQTLVSMLAMLANTHEGSALALVPNLHNTLVWLVGPDPLQGFDIEDYEEAYAELLEESDDPLIGEFMLLLELISAYSAAASETEAARINPMALELRFNEVLADPDLMERLDVLREQAFAATQNRWPSRQELQRQIEEFAQPARHQLLLVCLDAERRLIYQDDLVDRVRRVCPQANQVVLGAFLAAAYATEAHLLIAEIKENDLVVMLDEIAAVYEFPTSAFTRQLAKTLKDAPLGIPKAFLSESIKTDVERIGTTLQAVRRVQLGPLPLTSAADRSAYLARNAEVKKLLQSLEKIHREELAIPDNLGHVGSIFVAGVVLYQFKYGTPPDRHIGNVDILISAGRDVVIGGFAALQLGAATVRFLAERPAEWDGLVASLATTGKVLAKISSVVTLISNAGATIRAFAKEDWWGVALLGAATIASTVAIYATFAVAVPGAPLVAAIAAAVATVLVLIDIMRKYVIAHTDHDLYEDTVIAHRLLFAPRFEIVAPDPGAFTWTVAYGAGDEVIEIGLIELAEGESRDVGGTVANWAIGVGITAVYAAVLEADDRVILWNPFPALAAETVQQGDGDGFVFLDDPLLTVTPRFESWIEVAADDFDEVLVQRGDPVTAGETVVAVWAGESFTADHDGIVGAVELGADPEYLHDRIRIWANVP